MFRVFLIISCYFSLLSADVKSTDGQLKFDVNSDGQREALLNATGLTIGTGVPSANLTVEGNALFDALIIGGSSGSANLNINGTFSVSSSSASSNITISETSGQSIYMVDTSSDNVVVTMPYAGNVLGRVITIKKISTDNHLWVLGGGNVIDQYDLLEIANAQGAVDLISNGAKWFILSEKDAGTVASSNLVAWYALSESSGTVVHDSTSERNDASVVGFTLSSNSVNAQFEKGVQLGEDGNAYMEIPNSSVMSVLDDNDYSISAWYRPAVIPPGSGSDNNESQTIVIKAGWHHGIFYESGSRFAIEHWLTDNGVDQQVKAFSSVHAPLQYYHVVGTFDLSASTVEIFVNGSSEGSSTYSTNVGTPSKVNTQTWKIGVANPGNGVYGWPANGIIDDVKIFDKKLSELEVKALYQSAP